MHKKINMEMNEAQFQEILTWIEFYFRFMLWQVDRDELRHIAYENDMIEEYENWVNYTRELFFNMWNSGASYSYRKKPIAYEIIGQMRHAEHKHKNLSAFLASSTPPIETSGEPLINISYSE